MSTPAPAGPVIICRMDKNQFSQFEERIQALIEGGFARLFAGRLQPREVALRLARAMEDEADLDDAGNLAAPNRYIVALHPDDHAALLAVAARPRRDPGRSPHPAGARKRPAARYAA